MTRRWLLLSVSPFLAVTAVISACRVPAGPAAPERAPRARKVMSSKFCAGCHPAIYAEHAENTHGRAFTDPEVRLATGRFDHSDCIRCHTPRPIFETGIGMNPLRRHHNLEEGNTCMSCHWKPDYDYAGFEGGAECRVAFDGRVGQVEACASCHRNHGTPYQWELAPTGKAANRTCVTCHMKRVMRPVAVGQKPRLVRSHVFPGVRSPAHVRRAYSYRAAIVGNEVVVTIKNKGCGHNFPTELKQRSVESLVVVRDLEGKEVARSRMVFRDPYKRPYGLMLPVNTQIPAGQTREHRVPIKVANGTVDCELHFKTYYPIEDHHPDLARMLEQRRLVFDGVTPSDKKVESAPDVKVVTPEGISARVASAPNLVDYARPAIGTVEIELPEGRGASDIKKLIELFQFPVPEGNRLAQRRLAEIGSPAVPQLIDALGSWDNKTFKQSMKVLKRIGPAAAPAVLGGLDSDRLYVRHHCRMLLAETGWVPAAQLAQKLVRDLDRENAIDRIGAIEALGRIGVESAAPRLRALLDAPDPDVVRAAGLALAALGDSGSTPRIAAAMRAAAWDETRRDLAFALAQLGSADGIPVLLAGLDHPDALIRERFFEQLFAVTGLHYGYDPNAPRPERLQSVSQLQRFWAANGGADWLRHPPFPGPTVHAKAWALVQKLATPEDAAAFTALSEMRQNAVSGLVLGLKYPPGFAARRARICELLGRVGSRDAAPFLVAALRDPVISVAAWAAWALESSADKAVLPALARYQARLLTAANSGRLPAAAGNADDLLAQVARSRLMLGDERAKQDLVNLLLSPQAAARSAAIGALRDKYGQSRGYDPEASLGARRRAAKRWEND